MATAHCKLCKKPETFRFGIIVSFSCATIAQTHESMIYKEIQHETQNKNKAELRGTDYGCKHTRSYDPSRIITLLSSF